MNHVTECQFNSNRRLMYWVIFAFMTLMETFSMFIVTWYVACVHKVSPDAAERAFLTFAVM